MEKEEKASSSGAHKRVRVKKKLRHRLVDDLKTKKIKQRLTFVILCICVLAFVGSLVLVLLNLKGL